jgi:tryptophan synthase alpha chain
MRDALLAQGVDLIALVGLNTDEDRLKAYAEIASGFAYFVSVLGTTGARDALPQEVIDKLALARKTFEVPLALGFGIKSPEQLEGPLGEHVDAVVFGSALVAHIAAGGTASEFMERWK